MNKVYDNGYYMLGEVKVLKEYLTNYYNFTSDVEEIITDIVRDLNNYSDDSILCINYDNGMGYTIESFEPSDVIFFTKE